MYGIHDMGGMHGFGPVIQKENEPVFRAPWEGRVFALNVTTPLPGGLRPVIEAMPPSEYLNSSYYEKWLHAKIVGLIAAGYVTEEELSARVEEFRGTPDAELERVENPELLAEKRERLAAIAAV